MILLIDNYDSFTWNLVHYLGQLGATVEVVRNDQLTVDEAKLQKEQSETAIKLNEATQRNLGG